MDKVVKVANYSHPLSEEAKAEIAKNIGEKMSHLYPDGVEVEEVRIDSQIDLAEPIRPQLDRLVELYPYGAQFMVPPALSFSASYLGAKTAYAQSDAQPPTPMGIIVLRGEGVPRRFVLAEIIYPW